MKLKDCYRGYTDTMGLFREIEESCDGALTPNGVAIWMDNHEFELSRYGIPDEDVLAQMEGNRRRYDRVTEKDGKITVKHDNFTETFENVPAQLMDVSDMSMSRKK